MSKSTTDAPGFNKSSADRGLSGKSPMVVDVAIVGGGPAATFTALYLLQQGIRPLIIEKETFPRYHIGESLTGEVGAALVDVGLESKLEASNYPVKYGVRVYGRGGKNHFWVPVMKRVRPGPGGLAPARTWQVRRDEFDAMLLDEACSRGAEHLRGAAQAVSREGQQVTGLVVVTDEGPVEVQSKVVVDGSGQETFLAQQGVTSAKERGSYANQVALYSRVRGEMRDPGIDSGNTLIFYSDRHRWSWFIPISEDQTSLGLVVPANELADSGLSPEAFFFDRIGSLNPALTSRLQQVEYTEKVRCSSNYSYRIQEFTGPGFLCVGDSHRFVDPIFSFGLYFAAREAQMAAQHLGESLRKGTWADANAFSEYARQVEIGQQVIQDLIDFFWEYPLAFQWMAHKTHTEDIADCFAGRVYSDTASEAILAMREVLRKKRAGETYQPLATAVGS
ncbi:MAG: NAD(P)/FAD-dependent oxidoreductase [Planctomycetota bacterium]